MKNFVMLGGISIGTAFTVMALGEAPRSLNTSPRVACQFTPDPATIGVNGSQLFSGARLCEGMTITVQPNDVSVGFNNTCTVKTMTVPSSQQFTAYRCNTGPATIDVTYGQTTFQSIQVDPLDP